MRSFFPRLTPGTIMRNTSCSRWRRDTIAHIGRCIEDNLRTIFEEKVSKCRRIRPRRVSRSLLALHSLPSSATTTPRGNKTTPSLSRPSSSSGSQSQEAPTSSPRHVPQASTQLLSEVETGLSCRSLYCIGLQPGIPLLLDLKRCI